MSIKFLENRTVICGAVRNARLVYFAGTDDNVPKDVEHTHFFGYAKETLGYACSSDFPTVSMTISETPIQKMISISPYGHVKLIGQGQIDDEIIYSKDGSPETRGHLRHIRTIGKLTFAVGMGRQVYRRDDRNHWSCLDQSIRPAVGEVKGFECMDGFKEDDLYAVGWDGEIWHYNGAQWSQEDSPTNQILTRVLCTPSGIVYASGRRGLILRGKEHQWEVVEQDTITDDIWDLAWYQGRLYLSTMRGVFTLDKEEFAPVDFGEDTPRSCYHLSAADGVLWSFGAKDLMAFDGITWSRID